MWAKIKRVKGGTALLLHKFFSFFLPLLSSFFGIASLALNSPFLLPFSPKQAKVFML